MQMCFTIEIKLTRDAIEDRFRVQTDVLEDFKFQYVYRAFEHPRIPVVTSEKPDETALMEWGLIPAWTRDSDQAMKVRSGTYNARAETLGQKPAFRTPYRHRRCWVIVHGFFEWEQRQNEKIPWYIYRSDNQPFAMAGLYDIWKNGGTGAEVSTFSIVTCAANPMMEKIHNTKKRMPVILTPENEETWLNPEASALQLETILRPVKDSLLSAHTVSKKIASGTSDRSSSETIRKVDYPAEQSLF
jgi:putative SOS response-associated peptidase YedK